MPVNQGSRSFVPKRPKTAPKSQYIPVSLLAEQSNYVRSVTKIKNPEEKPIVKTQNKTFLNVREGAASNVNMRSSPQSPLAQGAGSGHVAGWLKEGGDSSSSSSPSSSESSDSESDSESSDSSSDSDSSDSDSSDSSDSSDTESGSDSESDSDEENKENSKSKQAAPKIPGLNIRFAQNGSRKRKRSKDKSKKKKKSGLANLVFQ